ncbi:MAG: hypothetical protein A2700_00135 [Candidatus Blackburnbacteria bacterium RIFCSPHIGHO2_01_FULL_44_64]|uniref:Glycosyltransferase RgtA/B/C/D-like domain-containing protein n=1 Tax=Candidatus Blackburnbacteria bacterium RIFCSPHIGHO2_02_FULL_44_20 TaxID=1797516 RepID=A0A1G1V7Z6_9BACT|nr:MAG: hypothetical protein A2700_00135 [Candidatus Blackburnbacteria bacterium RIFCSPHIGHO2_01_FULL_44_64]OGY11150.1 MAG: hypothetical protein A3E16_01280 [Candidatus Blackburnbacteria bacterium RIFCSPHIGHO2_12_FULL_44_25]OGY11545.1 MAG: hypothetical protein A3D26_03275 [Candidatus Blackburnbacteria bacterium RIFCSPHIGHO2_02_FULL_44_20]OGY14102.1 MAG: hypothetical protein A3A62_01940 [Candidatus Blackburnbacteria bacterium RIFCSPLOWO2_01_FULL_44_43]OGY15760.1 MAG: hypothetical protein A3H88_0
MKKKQYLLLFLILILGLILRLYKIDNPIADWHSWRQADTASVGEIYIKNGIDLLKPRYHDISNIASGIDNPEGWRFVEFPVYNALHAALYKTYPNFGIDKWGRLTSVFISLISAVFLFLIGRKVLGTVGGLLASFFFVALPFNVFFSRVILPEPMAVLGIVASLWFFLYYIETEKRWSIYLSGVFFGLSLLVKPYTIFYGLAFLYLAYNKYKVKGSILNVDLWLFFCLAVSPFLYWRGWMWMDEYIRGIPHWKWAFNGDKIRFKPSFWWWILEERLGRLILGVWGTVPFAVGLIAGQKGKYPWLLHILFASQIAYVSTVATASVRHDYYQTLTIPAVSLVLAGGCLTLWNLKSFNKHLTRLATAGCVLAGLFFSFYQVKEFYKVNHPEIIIAGAAANKLLPKSAIIIAPYTGDTAFLYQTKRRGFPYIIYPLPEMINRLGAQYYVSVNFDEQTNQVMNEYTILEKTDKYVIVDLQKKK